MRQKFAAAFAYGFPKGVRSFMQFLAGGLLGLPVVQAIAGIKDLGIGVLLVIVSAAIAGIAAFAQNFAEELERVDTRPT
jgi:hypothetical protein